jgi:hypothetical protein
VAMACPIIPKPKKATRIAGILLAMKASRIRYERREWGQGRRT